MPTYTKETALYDTGAISDAIGDAAGQVNKYITAVGDDGIKVHPYNSTTGLPDTKNYTLIDANGMEIYQDVNGTSTKVADFDASGTTIGNSATAHSVIDANGQRFYAVNGTTQLANIGYGEGNTTSGTTVSPYYTFGTRRTTTTGYSSSSTYKVGDLCMYNDKLYVCIKEISTPKAWSSTDWRLAVGSFSMAEGNNTIASGSSSHAEGYYTKAIGAHSHAEGDQTIASGNSSHAEGNETSATTLYAHAEGEETAARGEASHAEGYKTTVSERYAHAEGEETAAQGRGSHAEGLYTIASSGEASHAEGYRTIARGHYSHAEGVRTFAANSSHAEGEDTTANGIRSHTQNCYTVATEDDQTVIGKYNAATVTGSGTTADPYIYANAGNYAFIIGNGTANTTAKRSNALTVDWNGNLNLAGKIKLSGGTDTLLRYYSVTTPATTIQGNNSVLCKTTFTMPAPYTHVIGVRQVSTNHAIATGINTFGVDGDGKSGNTITCHAYVRNFNATAITDETVTFELFLASL